MTIVLDDFHLLNAPGLAEGMARWIDALPLRAHLAILTRALPDLPLARWRAQRRLAQLGPDDLRFTVPELRALLVDLHGISLSDASLHVVAAKTEGWPAGIVLALHAAAAKGAAEAAQALGSLSGSTREIYEYLAQEAFARQAPETQRFMLATAAVTRFSLPLAEALVGGNAGRNREILDHLERSHLFIVPLDRERRWYRYHHLFQEFLQRTAAEREPDRKGEVHRTAAAWWEREGEAGEALHHLVEAGEYGRAAGLLSHIGLDMVAGGYLETLRRWLRAIPEEHWAMAPRLYLIRGLTEVTLGDARQATGALEEARGRLREAGDAEGELYALRWMVNVALWEGGGTLSHAVAATDEIGDRLDHLAPVTRAQGLELTARVAQFRGDIAAAERLFGDAVRVARSSRDDWTYLGCVRYQANFLWAVGRFREAEVLFEEMLGLTRRRAWWHEHAHFHVELAGVLLSVGRDDEAEHHLAEARLLQPSIPCRVLQADLALAAARSAARRKAGEVAETLLTELLGEGEAGARYSRFRFDARVELASLMAATEPAEARRQASLALAVASQFDPWRAARAALVHGVVTRSAEHCREAAAGFERAGARHWSALALLNAADLAPPEEKAGLEAATVAALRTLTDDGWDFLLAQAPPRLLGPYRADAHVGARIVQALEVPAPAVPARVVVRCLGPFQLIRGGRVLGPEAWGRAAPRRLLQYLLLQDRPVHREEIIEALWPDHLDHFRRALARASSSRGDARRAALAEAVGVYTGDLFADNPFEEWVQRHRDRLGHQYVEALTLLAEAEEAAGEHQAALARWQDVTDRDPGAEHAYRGLMRSYLALGRGADALRAFEACRRALADLGAVPSLETITLRDRISQTGTDARG